MYPLKSDRLKAEVREKRRKILQTITDESKTGKQIAEELSMTQGSVNYNLRAMAMNKIVTSDRTYRNWAYWRLVNKDAALMLGVVFGKDT